MAVVTGQALLLKGTNGLSILLGSGPPANTLGVDGQPGYLDTTNNQIYGPKVSGAWPTTGNQFGGNFILKSGAPASTDGMVGNLSLDINAGFIYGPKTSGGWPSQPLLSLVGPRGPVGPQGPSYTLPADVTANSLILAPVSGANAVQLAIKNSAGTILWGVDTNGNEVVGGTLNVTGNATFNANVSAKVASVTGVVNSGNESIAGTLNVTGTSTLGTTKVTNVTFPDGTSQTTATVAATPTAVGSRCILDMGGYYHTNINTAFWTPMRAKYNALGGSPPVVGFMETFFKAPFPFTITGWFLNQYVANGTNQFTINKNRTSGSLNTIVTVNAGNATVNGFPGNPFSGTFTKGTYNFAAGDVLSTTVAFGSGTSTNMDISFVIEWT